MLYISNILEITSSKCRTNVAKALTISSLCLVSSLTTSQSVYAENTAPAVKSSKTEPNQATKFYQIPAGPLSTALTQFSAQAGIYLVGSTKAASGKTSNSLNGSYTVTEALENILAGSGLSFRFIDSTTVSLEKTNTVLLDPIRVIGTVPKRYEATSASSATGIEVPIRDTPRSIQVVPEQVILDQQSQDLRDLLRNVSGIQSLNPSGGTTEGYIIRGIEVGNIFQDGVSVGANNQRIQTANIERVEVVKGPNAILYGTTDAGGLINVVTKRPQEEARHTATGSYDEFGHKELLIDTTGPLNDSGSLLYRVVGSIERSDTFRETDKASRVTRELFAPSLAWQISDSDRLTTALELTSGEVPFDGGTVVVQDAAGELAVADVPRSRRFGEDSDISDSKQGTAIFEYEHLFNDDWALDAKFNYQKADIKVTRNGPLGGISALPLVGLTDTATVFLSSVVPGVIQNTSFALGNGLLLRSEAGGDVDIDRYFASLQLSGDFELGSIQHSLVTGFDYNRREFNSTRLVSLISGADSGLSTLGIPPQALFPSITVIDIFNPVYGKVEGELTPVSEREIIDTQIGLYAQDLITLNKQFKAALGFRVDYFKRDSFNDISLAINPANILAGFVDSNNFENLDQKGEFAYSPNLGLIYQPIEPVSIFASYSESFEPNAQSVNALNGETVNIPPTEGEQYEIGLKGNFLNDKLFFNLAWFDITRTNVPGGTEPGTGVILLNGEEKSQGIELDTSVQFSDGLNLIFNYAYIDAEVSEGPRQGNKPGNSPRHAANLWLTYEFTDGPLKGFGLGGGALYRGKRFSNSTNVFELDNVTTFDATAFYYAPLGNSSQLRLQAGVKNLTDERYFLSGSTLNQSIGAPRTVFASIGIEF